MKPKDCVGDVTSEQGEKIIRNQWTKIGLVEFGFSGEQNNEAMVYSNTHPPFLKL